MFSAVINRPPADVTGDIEKFRETFDNQYGLIPAHMTLVFPMEASKISQANIVRHLKEVAKNSEPFMVSIESTELSFDKFLFLVPRDKNPVIKLHDQLYGGDLAEYLRKDIKFIPHIGIGQFTKDNYDLKDPKEVSLDEARYEAALNELNNVNHRIEYVLDNIELISVDEKFTQVEYIEKIKLGAMHYE